MGEEMTDLLSLKCDFIIIFLSCNYKITCVNGKEVKRFICVSRCNSSRFYLHALFCTTHRFRNNLVNARYILVIYNTYVPWLRNK